MHQANGRSSKHATFAKNDERAVHIQKHLRKISGDTVAIGIVGGCKGKATIQLNDAGTITLLLQDDTFTETPNGPEITVILALPFPGRLKALWPVLASFCAVTRVVVVKGRLSNEEFCETSALQQKVYGPLIEKGMSQGVRTRPVDVDICVDEFISKELLNKSGVMKCESTQEDGIARLFLDCGDETTIPPPSREIVLKHCSQSCNPKAIIAIGPERGWTDEEAKLFVDECGFESATLGSSILRVDTAAIASVGIISAALDECQTLIKGDAVTRKERANLLDYASFY